MDESAPSSDIASECGAFLKGARLSSVVWFEEDRLDSPEDTLCDTGWRPLQFGPVVSFNRITITILACYHCSAAV